MSRKDKFGLMTSKELKSKRDSLLENIEDWNKTMSIAKSNLIQLCLIHYIKKAREEIRLIELELENRNKSK